MKQEERVLIRVWNIKYRFVQIDFDNRDDKKYSVGIYVSGG